MKKIIFILCVFGLFSCAITDQQKAEKAVKEYLISSLNNSKSYESVSFGKLVPNYTKFEETNENRLCLDKIKNTEEKLLNEKIEYDDLDIHYTVWKDKLTKVKLEESAKKSKLDSLELKKLNIDLETKKSLYQSKQKGWAISHTFRAENGYGATIKVTKYFELSFDLKVEREL